ncbi:hypothetical protein [Dictyobacter aurantiacus]|uniref:Uncharacterized protein n=1 Tax=Dictyobacter aurantiacus TaxID=1936993 RepID=A0A401ZTA7_9CHLR|nr:hypothetical protein [Dictyobacter aurantiacus]GCE10101.1 hypothetical protein KDAU_74300 [Dictyobacter aurantiacus]
MERGAWSRVGAVCDVGQFLLSGRETAEAQLRQAVERAPQEGGELCIGEAMWVGSGCAFEA